MNFINPLKDNKMPVYINEMLNVLTNINQDSYWQIIEIHRGRETPFKIDF